MAPRTRPAALASAGVLVGVVVGLLASCGTGQAGSCATAAGATPPSTSESRIELVAADEPYFSSTSELEAAADVIVRGRVDSTCAQTRDGIDERVADVVVRAAVGDLPAVDEVLTVAYLSPDGGTPMSGDLVEGEEYVLLLTAFKDGRHVLVNTTQGYYEVDGSSAAAREGNEVDLSTEVRTELGLTG